MSTSFANNAASEVYVTGSFEPVQQNEKIIVIDAQLNRCPVKQTVGNVTQLL
jgi:hypothetical protein